MTRINPEIAKDLDQRMAIFEMKRMLERRNAKLLRIVFYLGIWAVGASSAAFWMGWMR